MVEELSKYEAEEKYGPLPYELGATVAKFRREAAREGGVMAMTPWQRRAYADAIEKAIRAKHRTLHMKPTPKETGGWYSPPSITRLLRYENPLPMRDDPPHDGTWEGREQKVYAAMMQAK